MSAPRTLGQLWRALWNMTLDGDLGRTCDHAAGRGDRRCSHPEIGCAARGEPSCLTDTPYDGWPHQRNLAGRIRWVLGREADL